MGEMTPEHHSEIEPASYEASNEEVAPLTWPEPMVEDALESARQTLEAARQTKAEFSSALRRSNISTIERTHYQSKVSQADAGIKYWEDQIVKIEQRRENPAT